jgi:hypothetical protein
MRTRIILLVLALSPLIGVGVSHRAMSIQGAPVWDHGRSSAAPCPPDAHLDRCHLPAKRPGEEPGCVSHSQ